MTRISHILCFSMLLVGAACTSSVGPEMGAESSLNSDEPDSVLPPFPQESVLCRIVYNESTPEDVAALLGAPVDTLDSGGGSVNLFYDYADGASLFVGFLHGVFDDAMVDNASYPKCWRDAEMAAVDQLRRIGQREPAAD